jgi:MerR family transcriptional regulator, light-induced transcriptional regulator
MTAPTVVPDRVREAFLAAIATNDAQSAAQIVTAAVDDGMPVHDAYHLVIQPALYEVGRRWERGELSVAQEHLATAAVQSLIAHLSARLTQHGPETAEPGRGRAIVACTPGELHAVGARFVADFLEGDGWEVLALGPSTPIAALIDLVRTTQPAVVALSTTLPANLDAARAVLADLAALDPRPLVIAGGSAYAGREDLARELGADAYAADAQALRDLLRDTAAAA